MRYFISTGKRSSLGISNRLGWERGDGELATVKPVKRQLILFRWDERGGRQERQRRKVVDRRTLAYLQPVAKSPLDTLTSLLGTNTHVQTRTHAHTNTQTETITHTITIPAGHHRLPNLHARTHANMHTHTHTQTHRH